MIIAITEKGLHKYKQYLYIVCMSKSFTSSLTPPSKNKLPDLKALKESTDLLAVVKSFGIKLKKEGADHVALCPFHDEKTPSFRVTPSKNLFRCCGCGVAGSVIDFVMHHEKYSKQQAIDWLVRRSGGAFQRAATSGEVPSLPQGVNAEALLKRVVAFYAKALHQDRAGLEYLKLRKLDDPTMLEVFQVGYCNGTLNKALPKSGDIVEGLKVLGILNAKGNERFYGRVVVPIFDLKGEVVGIYGRKIKDDPESPRHLYLPGEHKAVFNAVSAKTTQTLILCEAIFDAMSFWAAGFRNAVPLYGADGWTPHHEALIRENGTTEVYLALDNDETGRRETPKLKEKLLSLAAKAVHVIEWPDGVKDANDFFVKHSAGEFEALMKKANPSNEETSGNAERLEEKIEMLSDGFVVSYGVRRYELRAIEKPSGSRLKATIKATGSEAGRFHIDTVDFYLSRSRRAFIIEAARLFRDTPEVVEMDLNRLTVQVEEYIEKKLEAKTPVAGLVSEGEKIDGLRLGRSIDLVSEILRDIGKLGVVGEKTNALIAYVAMTSRKMEDPLALLTLSGSGAGKSHLQDAVLTLCPEEDLIKVTSLSDRALFYKGEDSLKHKVLAIEEEEGASGADYAIRNLISSKKLVCEVTIKNPLTGKMETQVSRVNGPASVMKTTTNPETNPETRSRFIITSVDESPEQTRAILELQRNSHTMEGLIKKKQRAAVIRRHHAFQRMLKPLAVVNPFEPLLSYGDDRLLFRRDHPKYLSLILAVAFLHQMQRAVKHHPVLGDHIEVTLDDIAIANELALELFGASLDDLSSPSRQLLRLTFDYAEQKAAVLKVSIDKVEVSRRELREAIKWSEYQLRTHVKQLVELGYLAPISGRHGQLYCYRVLYDGSAHRVRFLPGLKTVEQIRLEAEKLGIIPKQRGVNVSFEGQNGHFEGTSRVANLEVLEGGFPSENGVRVVNFEGVGGMHINGKSVEAV
jgi:DNA primase